MSRLGPYSKEIILGKTDGRTKQGRLVNQVRRALTQRLGGEDKLTPEQRLLIERAAHMQLRCAMLDARIAKGTFTQNDNNAYVAFSNGLRLCLQTLALDYPASGAPPQSLAEIIAQHERVA